MPKQLVGISQPQIESLIKQLSNARKYRGISIPRETLVNLVEEAAKREHDLASIEKIVRLKLHNLAALYLGDPDYSLIEQQFSGKAFQTSDEELRGICLQALLAHASTAERIPFLAAFYEKVFAYTGKPVSILDLACGLNPFAIPWMQLPVQTKYLAYDLNLPRIRAINTFFTSIHQAGAAIQQDILVDPPQEKADLAFFFKEAHRFEQRKKGCNRDFFAALPVKTLLVSLPTSNLTGSRGMLQQDRALIAQATADTGWQVDELQFENEIVFGIRKSP